MTNLIIDDRMKIDVYVYMIKITPVWDTTNKEPWTEFYKNKLVSIVLNQINNRLLFIMSQSRGQAIWQINYLSDYIQYIKTKLLLKMCKYYIILN